jgi:hypothetical protein
MDNEKVFQEVDVFELLREIGSKNKSLNAAVLKELEKYVTDDEEYMKLRKFILDEQNSYTRSIVRLIFGDIEFSSFTPRK